MRLDIRHWEMLKAINETGTLRQAAYVLGITQSALSHRLAEAERRLGGLLFEREGRKLRQTSAGRAMIQTANQIIPTLQRAEFDFQQMADNDITVVRFGVAAYSCYHWLPSFLKEMSAKEPGIQLELVASATQNPLQNLQEGSVDAVLAPGHLAIPGIDSIPVFQDELVLVTHPEHTLATKPFIEATDLESEEYLTYSKSAQPGFEYERFIRPSGTAPHLVTVVEVTDAIIELIAAGFGVSILSRWAVQSAIKNRRVSAIRVSKESLDLGWSALMRESEPSQSASRVLSRRLAEWF
ncbi:LysR family transcriptional regulator [Amphritea japonica]|uniref:LysR family transcriptional regulator, regulator for metE and metH n=1 Tax=Amphritea japonica ATCC BAA-1530 TaxID=1278309 RepID=A0A7R6PAC0_9GAMM|nr:LysR substrate-binding domain-containing protein [Amphritea japonica]BBB25793.1 LysR family transcriptional regulator, regulator for metE and metH [Amphritea japonica ATCC BAA-1530]